MHVKSTKNATVSHQLDHAMQDSPSPASSRPDYLPRAGWCLIKNELVKNGLEKGNSHPKRDSFAGKWL